MLVDTTPPRGCAFCTPSSGVRQGMALKRVALERIAARLKPRLSKPTGKDSGVTVIPVVENLQNKGRMNWTGLTRGEYWKYR
jgi:hypothetical protein